MIGNRCPSERPNRKELALHEPLTLYQLKVAKYVFTFNYKKAFLLISHWKLLTKLSKPLGPNSHVCYLTLKEKCQVAIQTQAITCLINLPLILGLASLSCTVTEMQVITS